MWGGKINLTSETEAAYQNRVFDRISPLRSAQNFLGRGELLTAERVFDRGPVRLEPKETVRFDTNNVINAPFHILGQRFNPFIGFRFTGYSESVSVSPVTGDNKGGGSPRGRVAIPIGLNTSRTLSRTYSIYNKLLNINRLRHIMVPELAFNFIPIVTQNPEDLNQFDGIDAIDKYQSVKLRLRNRLQTKRGEPGKEKPVNLVELDTEFNFFPGSSGLNRKRDDYIRWDLRVQLTDKISFISEGNEFNLGFGGVGIFNTSLRYNNTPKWNFTVGSRYIDNISSTVNFSSTVSLNEKWGVTFYEQYAFRTEDKDAIGRGSDSDTQSLNTGAVINRYFHDWLVSMTISQIGTRDDDNIVKFNLIPRGLGPTTNRQRSVGAFLPQAVTVETLSLFLKYIMRKAVYPGTFDPVTYGHLDVIKRGSKIFDELIVSVGHNPLKQPLFTITERMDMISKNTRGVQNIKVDCFDGMLTDYMKELQTNVILRGIRTLSDFDYEFQRALTNRVLKTDVETVFIMTSQDYSYLNSSLIKEAVSLGGDISMFVPSDVEKLLQQKFENT